MDLQLNEELLAFREAAREFAQARMAPFAAQWDAEHHFPKDVLAAGGELGFCGLYAPEDIGGLGVSRLASAIVFEELAVACPRRRPISPSITWRPGCGYQQPKASRTIGVRR